MKDRIRHIYNKAGKDIVAMALIWAMVTALLFVFFELWRWDLSVPLCYGGGDEFSILNTVRVVQESGWNIGTDKLSATSDYYYNNNEIISGLHNSDVFLAKLFLTLTGGNVGASANLVYLSIFYLSALVMYVVMRSLNVKRLLSAVASLVYAFIPFVFVRGMGHLSLSCVYFIPLAFCLAIWVYEDETFMSFHGGIKAFLRYKRNWYGMVMAFLIATQGIGYWQIFACFVIMVATLSAFLKGGGVKSIARGVVTILCICLAVFINCIPVFISVANIGYMSSAGRIKYGGDGEYYGLKIVQMILPLSGHGNETIQYYIDMYNNNMPLVNENRSAYLGIFGICGFVFLCFILLLRKCEEKQWKKRVTLLSEIVLFSVLLGTVGGVGSIIYALGFKSLRSYNRISVYIGCACIMALCIAVDWFIEYIKVKKLKIVAMVAVMAVAFISVLEQNPGWVADYEGNKERWNSDKTFMAEVENVMDSGDKIYQLPYQSFPESVEQNNMNPLEQLTGFIHSRNLRWSYGTMPDSHEDKWYRETSDLSVQTMVEEIQLKGFDGIYINRTGYEEEELGKLEEELSNLLNEKPIISDDKRLSFFKIR